MSYLDEQRNQLRKAQSGGLPSLGFILILLVSVVGGYFGAQFFFDQPGVAGRWRDLVFGAAETAAAQQNIRAPQTAKRLGRAEAAPVYTACANTVEFLRDQPKGMEIDPRITNLLLQFGNRPGPYLAMAGPLLLCALEHNVNAVCDPDNRAMIVDGVNRFFRMADKASAPGTGARQHDAIAPGAVTSLRAQVVHAVERQARAGRLIKSDFGWLAHGEIARIFAAVTANTDACAKN